MDSWADVEVISIHDEQEEGGYETADEINEPEAVEEIFSQLEPPFEEETTPTTVVPDGRSTRDSVHATHAAPTIDLTATAGTSPSQRRHALPRSTVVGTKAVLSFQEEYDDLMQWHADGQGNGGAFPGDALSELLLRHPDHWWCR